MPANKIHQIVLFFVMRYQCNFFHNLSIAPFQRSIAASS
jgi:hypothetical protein